MELLLLSAPAQHTTSNTRVILDPRKLKKWIDELPEIDIQSTVQQLSNAITEFNELVIDDKLRLKLLQIYYETLQDKLIIYDEIRISMLQISIEARNKLREDVMWLYLSLANGYKLIIKNAFEKKIVIKHDQDLCSAIYMAMELIIDGIIYAYRAHLSPPPLARLEINQLYHYAYSGHIIDTAIKSRNGYLQVPTISTLYKQHILITICDPYHLNATDILELFIFLELIADECVIEIGAKTNTPEGKYYIDLFGDENPVPCVFVADASKITAQSAIIDVWPIVNTLAAKVAVHEMENRSFAVLQEKHMIDVIIRKLGDFGERMYPRIDTSIPVSLGAGMSNVHHVLQRTLLQGDDKCFDEFSGESVLSDWVIKNESSNGYLLVASAPDINIDLIVGEVLCILHDYSSKPFSNVELALVRWIRREQDRKLRIGVERIRGKSLPIFYQMESEYGIESDEESHAGIYMPRGNEGEVDSIVVMKNDINKDRKIIMYLQNKKYITSIVALLLDSPLYIRLKIKA